MDLLHRGKRGMHSRYSGQIPIIPPAKSFRMFLPPADPKGLQKVASLLNQLVCRKLNKKKRAQGQLLRLLLENNKICQGRGLLLPRIIFMMSLLHQIWEQVRSKD